MLQRPFNVHENLDFDNVYDIQMTPKHYEAHGYVRGFGSGNHLAQIACFTS